MSSIKLNIISAQCLKVNYYIQNYMCGSYAIKSYFEESLYESVKKQQLQNILKPTEKTPKTEA